MPSREAIVSVRSSEEYDVIIESVCTLLSEQGYTLVEGLGILCLIRDAWINGHEVDDEE